MKKILNFIAITLNRIIFEENSFLYEILYFFSKGLTVFLVKNKKVSMFFNRIYISFFDYPKLALIHPGVKCNRNCEYCYERAFKLSSVNSLSLKEYDYIFKELKQMNITQIQILGGEPLLYDNLKNLLILIEKYDFEVNLYTNGILLEQENISILQRVKDRLTLSVSLEHEGVKNGKNNFEIAFDNMILARKNGLKVKAFIVVTKENYKNIGKIVKRLVSENNIFISFVRYIPVGDKNIDNKYMLSSEKWQKVLDIQQFIYRKLRKVNLGIISALLRGSGCSDYFDSLHISHDGKVSPCDYVSNSIVIGDLRTESLFKVWKKYKENRSVWNRIPEACKDCDQAFYCTGGRKSYTYVLNGRFDQIDPLCKDQRCPLIY